MLRKLLTSTAKFKKLQGYTCCLVRGANQPLRFFSHRNKPSSDKEAKFNVDHLFNNPENKEQQNEKDKSFTYPDPQVYFLKRNFPKLARVARGSFVVSGLNLGLAGYFLFFTSWNPLFAMVISLLSLPFALRGRMINHNLKKSVSVIELSSDQKFVEITYGPKLKRIWTKVKY